MRAVMIITGIVLLSLSIGCGYVGVAIWRFAVEVAPDRSVAGAHWASAEHYAFAAITFAALGLLCLATARVLYWVER